MIFLRPVTLEDLDQLVELAGKTGYGLTTLPRDPDFLRRRITQSMRAFEHIGDKPTGETFLFVLEHYNAARIIGTSGVCSKVGGFEPCYMYRIETHLHESKELGIRREIPTLHLVVEHNGPAEIGSLFLDPQYRRDGNGRFLSQARFLFMAEHPQAFDPVVIAEMRGIVDDAGRSPLWEALGRHFFDVEFPTADYLSLVNKRFIADLMPTYPVYIPLLPPEAQAVIGKCHEQTCPALRILEQEGFRFDHYVDIFEGGPIVSCPVSEIRTVRTSVRAVVREISADPIAAEPMLVASVSPEFRATRAPVEMIGEDGIRIDRECSQILGLSQGSRVRIASFARASDAKAQRTPAAAGAGS